MYQKNNVWKVWIKSYVLLRYVPRLNHEAQLLACNSIANIRYIKILTWILGLRDRKPGSHVRIFFNIKRLYHGSWMALI